MNEIKLKSIEGNQQSLDGGAMFGNAPKAMWSQWLAPDENNCVVLSTRALLIQEPNRNILLEAGVGAYMPPKQKKRFGVIQEEHCLLKSLENEGLSDKDIDIIILSHLHFDHAGGLLSAFSEREQPTLLFPNATFVMSQAGYARASSPHSRDRASFIPELMSQLDAIPERLHLISDNYSELLGDNYFFHYSDGHTPGLLMTEVNIGENKKVLFVSDLIPGTQWVHVPISMGYDRAPELLIDEKKALLDHVISNEITLFFEHDPDYPFAKIEKDAQGRYIPIPSLSP